MADPLDPPIHVAVHEPLIGTRVQLRIRAEEDAAVECDRRIVAEVRRLERVFSVHDPASDLRRWRAGDDAAAGPELVALLAIAAEWFDRGGGAFHPATATATARWRRAEAEGVVPDDDELAALAAAMHTLPFTVTDPSATGARAVRRLGRCDDVDLNAIAKGRIVDLAAAAGAAVPGVESVTVNAGGDLLHRGTGSIVVGIEDPHRPYDNVPPLDRLRLAGRAPEGRGLATSGSSRRGFRVGGVWYGHVIDPRTARPVDHVASASVVAGDAATADVAATVLGVLPVAEALRAVAAWPGVECLIVDRDGTRHESAGWRELRV